MMSRAKKVDLKSVQEKVEEGPNDVRYYHYQVLDILLG